MFPCCKIFCKRQLPCLMGRYLVFTTFFHIVVVVILTRSTDWCGELLSYSEKVDILLKDCTNALLINSCDHILHTMWCVIIVLVEYLSLVMFFTNAMMTSHMVSKMWSPEYCSKHWNFFFCYLLVFSYEIAVEHYSSCLWKRYFVRLLLFTSCSLYREKGWGFIAFFRLQSW